MANVRGKLRSKAWRLARAVQDEQRRCAAQVLCRGESVRQRGLILRGQRDSV